MIKKSCLFFLVLGNLIFFSLPVFGQYYMSYEYLLDLGLQNVAKGHIVEALNYLEEARLICPRTPAAYEQLHFLEEQVTPYFEKSVLPATDADKEIDSGCQEWKERVTRQLNEVIAREDIKTRQMKQKTDILIYRGDFISEGLKRIINNRRRMEAKIFAQEIALERKKEALSRRELETKQIETLQAQKQEIETDLAALDREYREQQEATELLRSRLREELRRKKEQEEGGTGWVSQADFIQLKEDNRILSTENDFLKTELKRVSEHSRRQDALIDKLEERIQELSRKDDDAGVSAENSLVKASGSPDEESQKLSSLLRRNEQLSNEVDRLKSELSQLKQELQDAREKEIQFSPILDKLNEQLRIEP